MERELINPQSMYTSLEFGFSHAAVSAGGRMIHCAGQVAWDRNHNVVGEGNLAKQLEQALDNLKTVLKEAGASPGDVVRLRTYVVDHRPEKLELIGQALAEFYGHSLPAPNTLIGVQSLALPDFLVEIEATAVVENF